MPKQRKNKVNNPGQTEKSARTHREIQKMEASKRSRKKRTEMEKQTNQVNEQLKAVKLQSTKTNEELTTEKGFLEGRNRLVGLLEKTILSNLEVIQNKIVDSAEKLNDGFSSSQVEVLKNTVQERKDLENQWIELNKDFTNLKILASQIQNKIKCILESPPLIPSTDPESIDNELREII